MSHDLCILTIFISIFRNDRKSGEFRSFWEVTCEVLPSMIVNDTYMLKFVIILYM